MKSSLVLCVLLGVILPVRAASLTSTVATSTFTEATSEYTEATSELTQISTPTTVVVTTVPNTSSQPFTSTPLPTPATNPPTQSQIMCPHGWELFQGQCYYFVNDGMTWPQAQSNCALLESTLVSVHSIQEYGFLQQLTYSNGMLDAWMGGFYLEDQWLWIDGSWFYNISWINMSPDSSNPCLMLNSYMPWNNAPCNNGPFSSICVKNSEISAMLCPQGWMGFHGRCYFYNSDPTTWPEADANCASLEASLVSVHSPEEYSFLYQQSALDGFTPAWLGGFYLDDQWMWLDGSWFYQGFFSAMSPDTTYPCLATYVFNGWTNFNCDQAYPSFCVKDAL